MSGEQVMGYGVEDQAIVDSIHKKLNRGQAVEQPKAPPPLPTPPAAKPQPLDVGLEDSQPTDQALDAVAPAEGQPAEGQTAEGDAPVEAAPVELPPTLKVTIKDDEGKDVEQELPVDEVRSGYMRHADYTRKTQALAKERAVIPQKIAEADRLVTDARAQFGQALQNLQAFVTHAAAPELQNVNWNQLSQENPTEYVRLKQRAEQVNATLAQIQNYQREVSKQAEAQQKKAMREAAQSARETLNREIPGGWNDDLYAKIQKAAVNHYGYTQEEFGMIVDARTIIMANDALKYRELVSGKPIAQQKVAQASPLAVKPGAVPTATEKRQSAVDKARAQAQKSGSVEDALAVLQAKRARTQAR